MTHLGGPKCMMGHHSHGPWRSLCPGEWGGLPGAVAAGREAQPLPKGGEGRYLGQPKPRPLTSFWAFSDVTPSWELKDMHILEIMCSLEMPFPGRQTRVVEICREKKQHTLLTWIPVYCWTLLPMASVRNETNFHVDNSSAFSFLCTPLGNISLLSY